jgi:hypothetical protein
MSEQGDEKAPWWPPMIQASFPPKLDAATLPLGTVMVLGNCKYTLRININNWTSWESGASDFEVPWAPIQELIDRGIEFRVPEAKP